MIIKNSLVSSLVLSVVALILAGVGGCSGRKIETYSYQSAHNRVRMEILDDDLVRFHYDIPDSDNNADVAMISPSPMFVDQSFPGPRLTKKDRRDTNNASFQTAKIRTIVKNDSSTTIHISDLSSASRSTGTDNEFKISVERDGENTKLVLAGVRNFQHAYGLGEQFITPGEANGDWTGRTRTPGNEFGNALVGFDDWSGSVGNAQFPVLFGITTNGGGFALILDSFYPQTWDFTNDNTWTATIPAEEISGYVWVGDNPAELRQRLMDLTGRPPVPPKSAFGLWISEFGFDDWQELDDHLKTLRAAKFPVDGFVLDLQWFGGIESDSENSQMGSLTWDLEKFPNPAEKIASLKSDDGVGIIVIEESYISRGLPVHKSPAERGYMAKSQTDDNPVFIKSWWGAGGMVDWTNPDAADFWHDEKRQPLIDAGVVGHWTDLGEPENFDPTAKYYGFPDEGKTAHRDIANAYNLRWVESIARGYKRHHLKQRPFIMSRSGTLGLQRYGAAMWSGDIGSRLGQLATHANVQMHMAMSGIDYFGADVGGFKRPALDGPLDELYTQWFAFGAMFDIPVRPHTANTENLYETAPDRVGHVPSNLANIRRRYALTPYYYSLAYRAYLDGEPVVPPMFYHFPTDPVVRELGAQKMIGPWLTAPVVAKHGARTCDVYLPEGAWIDFESGEWNSSDGQWKRNLPLYHGDEFRLPIFARSGAIIPMMYVDDQTMNVFGRRLDGTRRDELIVRVAPSATESTFTLFEDDGTTIAYQAGKYRRTKISQHQDSSVTDVRIAPAVGTYADAVDRRANVVILYLPDADTCKSVKLNGKELAHHSDKSAFDLAESGWMLQESKVYAKSDIMSVRKMKHFRFAH